MYLCTQKSKTISLWSQKEIIKNIILILQNCILHAIHVMKISNYKGTREAYTALLEKIVDASLRMGLELNLRQQSALAMLLEGASYNDIAQSFNISRSDAVIMTTMRACRLR